MFLLIELMQDQLIARAVVLYGLWHFVGAHWWRELAAQPWFIEVYGFAAAAIHAVLSHF